MHAARAGNLLDYLSQIPDPRGRQGRRFSLSAIMATVVCGILCGARGYEAIADWVAVQDRSVWRWLGYWRKPPCANTFRDLLMALDPAILEQVVRRWVESLQVDFVEEAKLSAVAMDGKSLCGTLSPHRRTVHLLALFDHQTGCVLSQMEVDGKTNEITAAPQLLETIVLQGRVITGDALLCQREISRKVIDSGGHYLLMVKDNQPELKEAIAAEFEPAFSPTAEKQRQSELDVAETFNKGHGRRERRRLQTSTRLTGHLDWPGLAQVCRLDRTSWRKGVEIHEVAYAILSVPRSQAKAAKVLEWWRGHWGIENRLHWVRDVQFGEDACRVRTGNAPQVLSGLRNAAISLLRSLGHTQIAQTLRENACRVDRLLARLGILKN